MHNQSQQLMENPEILDYTSHLLKITFNGVCVVYSEEAIRRLTWQARRGMLELDVLFVPFMEKAFRGLEEEDKDRFVKLLECEDQDLFIWFMQRGVPEDPELAKAVKMVLAFVQSK